MDTAVSAAHPDLPAPELDPCAVGSSAPERAPERRFSYAVVICVRLHDGNPWVLDRLPLMGGGPSSPEVIVVDFGSAPVFAQQVRSACERIGLTYLFAPDDGVFSLSRARNLGFRRATTPYVLFSDVDFVFRSDDFERIERLIGALALDGRIDQIVNLPAFHLSEQATERYLQQDGGRDVLLERMAFHSAYKRFGGDFEFVAPYSNVFLINAQFFEMVGGYDETFRGHGSEDFEFLTRAAIHTRFYPLPRRLAEDKFTPARVEFFSSKDYIGFRRLLELMCFPSETLGLKAFHLWHPKTDDVWRVSNDWKREKLKKAFEVYLDDPKRLLKVDFLPRTKTAVCVSVNPSHDGYFYPLRLAGYRIVPLYGASPKAITAVSDMLENDQVDAFAVFNPYMNSHRAYRDLFDKARSLRVPTIVVERGALPSTVYYADDVCYVSSEFSEAAFLAETFSDDELERAQAYVADLRRGASMLESAAGYDETLGRLSLPKDAFRATILVPLQLSEDMAVTQFVRDAQGYDDFVASLGEVVARHPDVRFIVKAHPLSGEGTLPSGPNVVRAERQDNIHALIDLCDAVVCYNSGVGLLALLHGKPLVTIGNAFYNLAGAGRFAMNCDEAVGLAAAGFPGPDAALVARLCAWFVFRKYSSFTADDDIRETPTRKIHAYQNILITTLRLAGSVYRLGRLRQDGGFEKQSYVASRL
ncbi:MAG: glycosyltransferase, partial [Hansschlegelia sp.]